MYLYLQHSHRILQMTEPAKKNNCPAKKIANKFGGVSKFSKIVGKHRSSVYRWTMNMDKGGTDGYIPTYMIPKVLKLAKEYDIELELKDFYTFD